MNLIKRIFYYFINLYSGNKLNKLERRYSRTELAQLDRAAFTWLHKFHKEWLEANSPASNHGKKLKTEAEYYREMT
jgi:hypothetical protein